MSWNHFSQRFSAPVNSPSYSDVTITHFNQFVSSATITSSVNVSPLSSQYSIAKLLSLRVYAIKLPRLIRRRLFYYRILQQTNTHSMMCIHPRTITNFMFSMVPPHPYEHANCVKFLLSSVNSLSTANKWFLRVYVRAITETATRIFMTATNILITSTVILRACVHIISIAWSALSILFVIIAAVRKSLHLTCIHTLYPWSWLSVNKLHGNRNKREASSTVSNFKSSLSIANTNEALTVELNTRSAERKPNGQSIWALINARSVCNKTELLNEFLISKRVDILLLVETWLTGVDEFDNAMLTQICSGGNHKFYNVPRGRKKKGGGIGLIVRNDIEVQVLASTHLKYDSFEHGQFNVSIRSQLFHLTILYRPPSSSLSIFLNEFSNHLAEVNQYGNVIIAGDFNINVNQRTTSQELLELISTFGMKQHVYGPTHQSGSTIDLIITHDKDESYIQKLDICAGVSDHQAVTFSTSLLNDNVKRPPSSKYTVATRSFKNVDHDRLALDFDYYVNDPIQWMMEINPSISVNDISGFFNFSVKKVIDQHAPIKVVRVKNVPPWLKNDILQSRKGLRKLERMYQMSGSHEVRELFKRRRAEHARLIKSRKREFSAEEIRRNIDNSKGLWKHLNTISGRKQPSILPSNQSQGSLATLFSNFFQTKIERLNEQFDQDPIAMPLITRISPETLSSFAGTTAEQIKRTIFKMSNTTSELDPMPTWLLRKHLNTLMFSINIIVKKSLCEGMPQMFKTSVIKPLYKKGSSDTNSLSSYRPVSNLPYLSKVVEKIVSTQIFEHLSKNELLDENQHAYKPWHSCETALLSIHNAAINAIDDGKIMLLVMLDLSAAFDMVNHSLLLKYCENMGIRDEALAWLEDYFSNRKQYVSCETVASTPTNLKTGVPQGSILGPLLFSVYISQIANVFEKYPEVRYVIYADDIQLFSSCNVIDVKATIRKLENCINDVKIWLHQHRLILNLSKTDFIVFHSKRTSLKASGHSLVVDGVIINQKQVVRNLGVLLDDGLNMDQHVSTICKNATYQLRLISRSRHFLTRSTVAILVHALAISRIEYCSSLLYGITSQLMRRIDKVIHYGVRLVEGLKRRDNVTAHRNKLRWLPAAKRPSFRIALLVHKAYKLKMPNNLAQLIKPRSSSTIRNLRSSTDGSLSVIRTSSRLGDRAFSAVAPKIWNDLPLDIRELVYHTTFKCKVLTHYLQHD
jgi:hypothetical protein